MTILRIGSLAAPRQRTVRTGADIGKGLVMTSRITRHDDGPVGDSPVAVDDSLYSPV
jgi:hypothetical protein